ncbi:hypothetical protein TNCV_1089561 [Trichonephila clavipes]|uniref:Uncharacterized protein n=1 Tax=Trichonephila clavipes TaxID=2585209 RepID=A0A8X6VR16_TRICX|nr:hypothetical protein TNCV_1089561 [Trichonephila clavipes]
MVEYLKESPTSAKKANRQARLAFAKMYTSGYGSELMAKVSQVRILVHLKTYRIEGSMHVKSDEVEGAPTGVLVWTCSGVVLISRPWFKLTRTLSKKARFTVKR